MDVWQPVDALAGGLRALSLLGLLQAAGALLFLGLLGPALHGSASTVRRIGRLAVLLAAILVVAEYSLEAGRLTGSFAGVVSVTWQSRVARSPLGAALLIRCVGLALIATGCSASGPGARRLGWVGIALTAVAFTLTGHTSVQPHRLLLAVVLAAHVVLAAFWLGAMLPLVAVCRLEEREHAGAAVAAFSAVASRLVPLLALAGLALTVALVPDWATWRTPYGWALMAKMGGYLVLLGIASLNRWRLGPALHSGAKASRAAFERSVLAEYALLGLIVMITAVMTTFLSPESAA